MPKKSKKGGKGKKGKGKAKGKKKKEKFTDTAQTLANTKLWEARLDATEKSRLEFRESAKQFALENEGLQKQLAVTERDTIEVISYMKRQDQSKEELISKLQKELKDTRRDARKEKQEIIADFTQRMSQMESELKEKSDEVKLMQSELKLVKEFRRKRGQMQKDLEDIKEEMFITNKEHTEQLQRMEHKFFEEKIRLQQEASQKIAELAERAHTEAVSKLDETTRSVYKENVRVNEALGYHIKESEDLKEMEERLAKENKQLKEGKELNELLVKEKVVENKKQKAQIRELQEKVQSLESALSLMVREFEREQEITKNQAEIQTSSSKVEIAKLLRTVQLQNKEMAKVKKLAKTILDQRTEMEQFFLQSLEMVKREIVANRAKYLKDASSAYQRRMSEAHRGRGQYPKIRNFQQSETSTNNVFDDIKAAESWSGVGARVDIGELTWEQRERILRLLFAKMNGTRVKSRPVISLAPTDAQKRPPLTIQPLEPSLAIEGPVEHQGPDATFITQSEPSEDLIVNQTTSLLPSLTSEPKTSFTTVS